MPPIQGSQQPVVDPYAFLNETKHASGFNGFGSFRNMSFRAKLIATVGGGIVLIILLLVLKSIFGTSHAVNMPSMYQVLGEQQELINLSTIGSQQTSQSSPTYLNFSATELASASTDQAKLVKLLAANGIKVSTNNYVLQPSADAALNQAIQVSNFDPVYASVMQTQLKLYQSDLSNAYNLSTSTLLKSYLRSDYSNSVLLMKMLASSYD